jgi:hypothetical protein
VQPDKISQGVGGAYGARAGIIDFGGRQVLTSGTIGVEHFVGLVNVR